MPTTSPRRRRRRGDSPAIASRSAPRRSPASCRTTTAVAPASRSWPCRSSRTSRDPGVRQRPPLRPPARHPRRRSRRAVHAGRSPTRSAQLLRVVQSEQVFIAVERAKYEHERFYRASAMLGRALTLEQVMDTAFEAAAEIADYDLAVVTLFSAENRKHKVQGVRLHPEPSASHLLPRRSPSSNSRTTPGWSRWWSRTATTCRPPASSRTTPSRSGRKRIKLRGRRVAPGPAADRRRRGDRHARARLADPQPVPKDIREMLGVIANQVATSLQNAMMYRKMETMATTDGLTGLTNHRTFKERFAQLLERSARHGHKAAVLLCDVDHFKKVNDDYGHPIGDEVLRHVARVLQGAVRDIDIPATAARSSRSA